MGVKGKRRKRNFDDEPALLKDVQSILKEAENRGFIEGYEVDIAKIIQSSNIELVVDRDMDSSMSGSLHMDKLKNKWIIRVNGNHSPKRQRFTMAHEYAHFCLHKDDRGTFVDETIYFRKSNESSIEYNADLFASELLMPEDKFRKLVEEGEKSLRKLSDLFNVSISAATIRAEFLGFKTKSNEK